MPFPASFCQSALRLVGGLTGRRRPGILGLLADEAGQHHSPRRLGPPGLPFIGAVLVSIWLGKVVAQLGQTTSVEARRPLALALLDQAAIDPRDSSRSPTMVRAPGHETQGASFPTRQYRDSGSALWRLGIGDFPPRRALHAQVGDPKLTYRARLNGDQRVVGGHQWRLRDGWPRGCRRRNKPPSPHASRVNCEVGAATACPVQGLY